MTPGELFEDLKKEFEDRKFAAGLLVAFLDLMRDLGVPGGEFKNFDAVLEKYPRQTKTRAGKSANTLIVQMAPGKTESLRPYYNKIERFFREEKKRYDYPSCAPHATQAWSAYGRWLDSICGFSVKECQDLRKRVCDFVLAELVDQTFDPSSVVVEPPLFLRVLEHFETTAQKGEPTGAALQGIVFGFLRADNPHLQIEIDKVRTGSKMLERVGDIDGWEGTRLALSAEVKQIAISGEEEASAFEAFSDEIRKRGALGIVAALAFDDAARSAIENSGLCAVSRDNMIQIVALWDPIKQRTAVASLEYYFGHVEKNSSLIKRLADFLIGQKKPAAPEIVESGPTLLLAAEKAAVAPRKKR